MQVKSPKIAVVNDEPNSVSLRLFEGEGFQFDSYLDDISALAPTGTVTRRTTLGVDWRGHMNVASADTSVSIVGVHDLRYRFLRSCGQANRRAANRPHQTLRWVGR